MSSIPAASLAESLRALGAPREELLAAAAQASRLLLESTDMMAAMPEVLQLFGEAAAVDRVTLATASTAEDGERWLMIRSQWNAPGIVPTKSCDATDNWDMREDCFCSELSAGRSVYICGENRARDHSIASDEAKSSILVPFMMDGEYAGAVGFDAIREERAFDTAVVSALEIAASVVGAGLQRERLLETMRREREEAAEQRVTQLARANAALRANLERLSTQPAQFFDHLLLDATRHMGAVSGTAVVLAYDTERWLVGSHVRDGQIEPAPFAASLPPPESPLMQRLLTLTEPLHVETRGNFILAEWPEFLDYHVRLGLESLYVLPLVFGDRNLGFVALAFRKHESLRPELAELLVAFGQQVTLAMGMKRLMANAKQGAVLAERNRIGREIHDGVAQAFTGILMQIGAAEEIAEGSPPMAKVLGRVRDIAREGLVEARRAVFALRPDEQRVGGLELALRQLAERSTVAGRIASTFNCNGTGGTGLPPEHEHALLRIAQEAVINAVRHAQPKNVEIRLDCDDKELVLSIRDDGRGMQDVPELYAQQGFGLANMRERAEAIGGTWRIESKPESGTRVCVHIPRTAAAQNRA